MQVPPDALSQLGDLPVVVAVLLISTVALVGVIWLGAKLLASNEASRRDERQARDAVFLKFIADQRELDRTLGKQTSDGVNAAIDKLADALRDNGTATVAMVHELASKVDDAMTVQSSTVRETNGMIAILTREMRDLSEAIEKIRDDAIKAKR